VLERDISLQIWIQTMHHNIVPPVSVDIDESKTAMIINWYWIRWIYNIILVSDTTLCRNVDEGWCTIHIDTNRTGYVAGDDHKNDKKISSHSVLMILKINYTNIFNIER
jgi:hypothetical protein